MGPTPEQIVLIRDYEPALFFSGPPGAVGSERFFPSDAKRYLERAALHLAKAPFATRADWGSPIVAAGKLGAIEGEASVFIGKKDTSASPQFPLLQTNAGQEHFLDVSGWTSNDTRANLDKMAALYSTDQGLNDSQYWYHAEFFDAARLRRLFNDAVDPGGNALNFNTLFDPRPDQPPILNDPALICYYLFYPAHEESLNGCETTSGQIRDTAKHFASFAGEWSCFAVLLDRSGTAPTHVPKWAGLTDRNLGNTGASGQEVRTTMRLLPWSAMAPYQGNHAQLNVALGTHGLYVPGEQPMPSRFDDPSTYNCGGASISDLDPEPPASPTTRVEFGIEVLVGKLVAGAATGFGVFGSIGSALGAGAGLIWGIAEFGNSPPGFGTYIPAKTEPGPVTTDTVGTNGRVIHPAGLVPPNVDPSRAVAWQSADDLEIAGRQYFFTVDRAKQVLWGDDPEGQGYTGRWGADVAQQPQNRRSGMTFPKFWKLFFEALVRNDPPARVIVLTTDSDPTWTVPADWNNANNTVECIGAGGGGAAGQTGVTFGAGGGGGSFSKAANLVLVPGAIVALQVGRGGSGGTTSGASGANGTDTYFNGNFSGVNCVGAKGGAGGTSGGPGGHGGKSSLNFGGIGGSTTFSPPNAYDGGAGGSGALPGGPGGGGGAGGNAGPGGAGAAGGVINASTPGSGGGAGGFAGAGSAGAGTGSPTAGAAGGNNGAQIGGGAGGVPPTFNGTAGIAGTGGGGGAGGISNSVAGQNGGDGGDGGEYAGAHGAGGGGGGGGGGEGEFFGVPGAGGLYGGGGGGGFSDPSGFAPGANGAPGLIVIRYTPSL